MTNSAQSPKAPALPDVPLAQLAAIFDALPEVVFFSKDAAARYTHANRTLLDRLGLASAADLQGRTAAEVFAPPLGQSYLRQDLWVLERGQALADVLELHLFPRHRTGWCLTRKQPLRDARGRVVGLLGISRDLPRADARLPAYAGLAGTLQHARDQLSQPLRVAALARHAGLSVAQLERHFLALFSLTPRDWLLRERLALALERLQGEGSVAEIAYAAGFADHSAFTRAFRRHVGLTPTQYRALQAGR